jgi:hypothetical protein
MALRKCGLLNFFRIQGMRAQLRLLEYLVHMWDVNEQVFRMGVHTLTLNIEDIYFLTWLSHLWFTGITHRKQGWSRTYGLLCSPPLCDQVWKNTVARWPSEMSEIFIADHPLHHYLHDRE